MAFDPPCDLTPVPTRWLQLRSGKMRRYGRDMKDRHMRFALLLRGIRWRAGASLAMFIVAAVGVGVGSFGPLYVHSADQSVLSGTLEDASSGNAGLTLQATAPGTPARLSAAARAVPSPGTARPWFGAPISTNDAGVATVAGGQAYEADLVSRTDVCAHVVLVAGTCPSTSDAVMLSSRSASLLGVALGARFAVSFDRSPRTAALTVVGLYRPGDVSNAYWWQEDFFPFGSGSPSRPQLDDLFSTAMTVRTLAPAQWLTSTLQFPFERGSLLVDGAGDFQTQLARYQQEALHTDNVDASSDIVSLLQQATGTEHTLTTIVVVVDLQLVLLALLVLYFVSARTAAEREPDVRLAELRGFRPRSALAVAMAEPIAILIAAVPAGLFGAWLVAFILAPHFFGSGAGAQITLLAVAGAVVTGVVGIGAAAVGTRHILNAPELSGQGSSGSPPWASTWRTVGDVTAVAVAVAAFIELALSGVSGDGGTSGADPLASFAPGLLALAMGVVGARLLPVLLRATFSATEGSSHVALALATRRVARRREFAPQIIVLCIAVALATFGVSGWTIAARNRDIRSVFDVGASRVLTVSVRPGVDFLSAERGADPTGRSMAVVEQSASDGTTLAVDSSRLARVASWPPGLGAGGATSVARRLVPRHLAPPVMVTGSAMAVTIDASVAAQPSPQLSVNLFAIGFQTPEQLVLGSLSSGTTTFEASLQGLCTSGCRLVNFALTWAPSLISSYPLGTADIVISAMAQRFGAGGWVTLAAGLGDVKRWASPSGGAVLTASTRGLGASVSFNDYGDPIEIGPADIPSDLLCVITPEQAPSSGSLSLVGLDGGNITGRSIGEVVALPGVGADASLVDLQMAERFLSGPFTDDATEVWLAPDAPADMVARLAQRGITVTGEESATAQENALTHGGVSLAYSLFLLAAVGAGVLAVGAAAFAVVASARRRRDEFAALRALGLPPRLLRRSVEIEQALTLGTGVVVGAVVGMIAAVVALGSIPEFVSLGPGPPLQMGLPGVALVVTIGAIAVALAVTVTVGASIVVNAASADKLGGLQ